jgi:hypothetical protein
MRTPYRRRLALCLALAAGFVPLLFFRADAAPTEVVKTRDFKGKVVPLTGLLEKIGSKLDADASPHWLALVAEDGKIYPLIKDDGARMFFSDPKLRGRPMLLTGRLFKDTNLLQVLSVRSYVKGKRCDLYYWCAICSIRRNQKQICECCGGPMVLREVPLKK